MLSSLLKVCVEKLSDNSQRKDHRHKTIPLILVLFFLLTAPLAGAVFFFQPRMADDYSCWVVYTEQGSFLSFVRSFYLSWTGCVQTLFIQGIAYNAPYLYKALTLGFWFGLAGLIYVANASNQTSTLPLRKVVYYVTIFSLLYFQMPAISETVVWMEGSTYLWGTFFCILFLLYYHRWANSDVIQQQKYNYKQCFLIMLLGLWAGCSHLQVIAGGLSLITFLFLSQRWLHPEKKLPLPLLLGAIAFTIGAILLIAAPGNYVRLQHRQETALISWGKITLFLHYFETFCLNTFFNSWLILLLLITPRETPNDATQKKHVLRTNMTSGICWLSAGFCTLGLMYFLIDFASERTQIFSFVFTIIGLGRIFSILPEYLDFSQRTKTVFVLSLCYFYMLWAIISNVQLAARNNHFFWVQHREREASIAQQKQEGKKEILLSPYTATAHRLTFVSDITDDPKHWINVNVARYYGVDSIRLQKKNR